MVMLKLFLVLLFCVSSVLAQKSVYTYDGPAFRKGLELQQKGNEQEAFVQWRAVLRQQPGHPGAYYHAGVGRYNLGELEKAKYNFERSFDYPAKGYNAHYFLGRIAEKQGDVQRARLHFNKYLSLTQSEQGIAEVKGRLAALSESKKNVQKSSLQPAFSSEKELSSDTQPKKESFSLQKEWKAAQEEFALGKEVEALAAMRQIVNKCKNDSIEEPICKKACMMIADDEFQKGRFQQASEWYLLALQRWPNSAEDVWGWYQLGNGYRGWNHQEMKKAYSKVVELYPEHYLAKMAQWKLQDAIWKYNHQDLIDHRIKGEE
jgi:tetratricopeptide (TPR) repeat protein